MMSKIKIICNPYKKENLFQYFNETESEWENINYENHPNSQLLSGNLHKGFFPFIVSKVVDEIVSAYNSPNENIELYFDGTDDDFSELELVCSYYDGINLHRENRYLNNANLVLEDIIKVFNNLKPIITKSESNKDEIENNLNKFLDTASEVIPLCILGNYSAGKSTFINALIGSEILPSGDEPLTAKVFKITQADSEDFACIKLCDDTEFMIVFNEKGYEFIGEDRPTSFLDVLSNELEEVKEESIIVQVNKALSVINKESNEEISKLIEVMIPFKGGLWKESEKRFVILDTPGSNSASNNEHLQVLEKALEGLTNGVAIYVSEYDSLDSEDNKKLYEKIKSLKELDSRFTFMVCNKADENDLPEEGYFIKEKEDDILNFTISKNLYTEGIFFVSSILGLGAKTNGEFKVNQRIIAGNAQFTGIAAGRGVGFTTGLLLLREGLGMRETPIRPHSWH